MIEINAFGNCQASIEGVGLGSCYLKTFGQLKGFTNNVIGAKFSVTPTEALYRTMITEGKLYSFTNRLSAEVVTPDNVYFESSDKLKIKTHDGIPEFNITFSKGPGFYTKAKSHEGNNIWEHNFLYEKGILLAQSLDGLSVQGFRSQMFDVAPYKGQSGTDTPEETMITIQLRESDTFNTKWAFYTWEDLGFNALDIESAIESEISYVTAPVAGSSLTVSVVDKYNKSVNYSALFDGVTDFKVLVNGVENVVTAVTATDEQAILTLTDALVSTDVVKTSLNGTIADDELKYYKSNTVTATLA